MPKITDDDDIDLDNIIPAGDADPEPDEIDADAQSDVEDDDQPGDNEPDPDGDAERGDQDDEPSDDDDDRQPVAAGDRGAQQQPRRSRASDRIRTLSQQLADERAARAEDRRRLDELAQRVSASQQPQPQRETADQRNQRRALMSAEERMQEDLTGALTDMGGRINQATFLVQDSADKSSFEAKYANHKAFSKYVPKVEQERIRLLNAGSNVAREAILHYLLGKAVAESYNSKENRQRTGEGARRVRQQTTRPGDTRSDTNPPRRGQQRSLEDRLANVPL